jgi:radical SAM protein with 4Fe4S-binding SPASM domain
MGHTWKGCKAGCASLGIEADGKVKGCPSLPSKEYTGGNVRELTIEKIWRTKNELRWIGDRTVLDLWGFCADCIYAERCKGGCTWTAHALFGRPGNNPYCHHRALTLKERGVRERLRLATPAPGEPFDYGRFELITEPFTEDTEDKDFLPIEMSSLAEILNIQPQNKSFWSQKALDLGLRIGAVVATRQRSRSKDDGDCP